MSQKSKFSKIGICLDTLESLGFREVDFMQWSLYNEKNSILVDFRIKYITVSTDAAKYMFDYNIKYTNGSAYRSVIAKVKELIDAK